MTIIDLVVFGPILQQLDALERDLTEQHGTTQASAATVAEALERQRGSLQRLTELRAQLRTAAAEHGRARLAVGQLHDRH